MRLEIMSRKDYCNLKRWYCTPKMMSYPWPFWKNARMLKDGRVACLRRRNEE